MGFFGKKKQLYLSDNDFGQFESHFIKGDKVGWLGKIEFLNETIDLYVTGTVAQIFTEEGKNALKSLLENQPAVEAEIDNALKNEFSNADIELTNRKDRLTLISLKANHDGSIEVTFEDKENYYLFNVLLVNNKSEGVSMDS